MLTIEKLAGFAELVRDTGSDSPQTTIQHREQILDRAGKSGEDLDAAVELYRQRQGWVNDREVGEFAKARVVGIANEILADVEAAKVDKLERQERRTKLRDEEAGETRKMIAANSATQLLRERHYDDSIATTLADLVERRKAVAPDVQRLGERLTRREARLESLRERKAEEFTRDQHHELRDLEREVENSTERLEELSAELQKINDEFDRLEARRLAP